MGIFAPRGVVTTYMSIPAKLAGQPDLLFPAIAVGTPIHLVKLDSEPEPLHRYVDKCALAVRPVDLAHLCLELSLMVEGVN